MYYEDSSSLVFLPNHLAVLRGVFVCDPRDGRGRAEEPALPDTAGKVCHCFGQGLFLSDRPCPLTMASTLLRARFGGQGLRLEIKPCPKAWTSSPKSFASLDKRNRRFCKQLVIQARVTTGIPLCSRNSSRRPHYRDGRRRGSDTPR